MGNKIYDIPVKKIDGTPASLKPYEGKVMLVVNVASQCGLTPQYEGLEALYKKYHAQGLEVLGFPANEFGAQEPGTNAEIAQFCALKFKVDFPMFEKIVVKGAGIHPLYAHLTKTSPAAILPAGSKLASMLPPATSADEIKWNFEKFLVSRDGKIAARFSPDMKPDDPLLVKAVEKELG